MRLATITPITIILLTLGLSIGCGLFTAAPSECIQAAEDAGLPDDAIEQLENPGDLNALERAALQQALKRAGIDDVCETAPENSRSTDDSYSNAMPALEGTNPISRRAESQQEGTGRDDPQTQLDGSTAKESVLILEDAGGRITNDDFEKLRQQTTKADNSNGDQMVAGHLPNGIKPRPGNMNRGAHVVSPDEFREIAKLYQENTIQLHQRFGTKRVIVSNWIKGITGVSRPKIVWNDGARCELETTEANIAAIAATSVRSEVVVSGKINYEAQAFLMTNCRIHGHYAGGYHDALPSQPRANE